MFDIRLPNINGKTEHERNEQIKSYLYQLAEQLQFALNSIEQRMQSIEANTASTDDESANTDS